eukprot:11659239-Alexandrium_andersonii.AAC.1
MTPLAPATPVGTAALAKPEAFPPAPTAATARSATTGFSPSARSFASNSRMARSPATLFSAA